MRKCSHQPPQGRPLVAHLAVEGDLHSVGTEPSMASSRPEDVGAAPPVPSSRPEATPGPHAKPARPPGRPWRAEGCRRPAGAHRYRGGEGGCLPAGGSSSTRSCSRRSPCRTCGDGRETYRAAGKRWAVDVPGLSGSCQAVTPPGTVAADDGGRGSTEAPCVPIACDLIPGVCQPRSCLPQRRDLLRRSRAVGAQCLVAPPLGPADSRP